MLKNRKNNILLICFVTSAFTASLFIIPTIFANGYTFTLGTDFNFQQITFMDHAKAEIMSGQVWSDNLGLGGDIVNILGVSNLFSPFSLLFYLIPLDISYLYFVGPFMILKFGVMGLTSALFFTRYLEKWQNILLASLLYSFSGTVFFNLNYQFLDSYALIPLLFWALDKAVLERKKGYLAITATALLFTSYLMFYMAAVYLLIYFVAKVITKEYLIDKKLFLALSFESVVSVMLSSVILFRAILPTFLNPRFLQQTIKIAASPLTYDGYTWATIVKGIILPAESLYNRGFFGDKHPDLPSLWLPVVGVVLVSAYLFRRRDKFARLLMGVTVVIMAIPILNAAFSLSLNHYYPRWFIMPTMFLALYSAKFFETKKRISPLFGLIPVAICSAALCYFYHIWGDVVNFATDAPFYQDFEKSMIFIAIAAISLVITIAVCYIKSRKIAVIILGVCVIIVSSIQGFMAVKSLQTSFEEFPYYGNVEGYFTDGYNTVIEDNEYVRYDNHKGYANLSILTGKPTVNIFSSILHQTTYELREILGEEQIVTLQVDHSLNYGFHTISSVKYIERTSGGTYDVYLPGFTEIKTTDYYIVYEYPYYIPMGFTFDSYITTEELLDISVENRDLALLKSLVIDEDIEAMLPKADTSKFDYSFESFEIDVENRKEQTADVFYEIKNGFYSEIELESDNIVFFSVPYDEGFSATVNGEEAEIYKVQGGFIGIPAGAGANIIEFVYTPPTLILEIILMVLGVVFLLIYLFYDKIRRASNAIIRSSKNSEN